MWEHLRRFILGSPVVIQTKHPPIIHVDSHNRRTTITIPTRWDEGLTEDEKKRQVLSQLQNVEIRLKFLEDEAEVTVREANV